MNIGDLASILNKDATELSSALKLGEGIQEVEPEIAKKEIEKLVNELRTETKTAKLLGIKEGEGKAERLFKTNTEKRFKEMGFEGESFDDFFASIETKIKSPAVNDDVLNANKALKKKVLELEGSITKIQSEAKEKAERNELFGTVKSKMKPILDLHEFATDKVKDLAIDQYLTSRKFIVDGSDIFLDVNGVPSAKFEDDVKNHLSDFGKMKEVKKPNPNLPSNGSSNYSNDLTVLNKQYVTATTAKEKQDIAAKIKSITSIETD